VLPRGRGWSRDYFRKVGTRKAQAISKVCMAATAVVAGDEIADIRIAFGSVAPVPLRCHHAEAAIRGHRADERTVNEAVRVLQSELKPIDDIRSTAAYRERVAANLLKEFLAAGR
jgi:xanthine dehydrogenase iron-sulfur cluster and FAD-binding subunit A